MCGNNFYLWESGISQEASIPMEKFSLEEALKRGISAHKEGKVGDADRYYTAILKAHPDHPDANHNIGVLAMSARQFGLAQKFLETALNANPNVVQFWLSYIDVLIKLERFNKAKNTIIKALKLNKNVYMDLNNYACALRASRKEEGLISLFK